MLTALKYSGGKATPRVNNWIRSHLPEDINLYCEPYGGMFSVLLNRKPANVEIVNDLSQNLINWWMHVVLHPERFGWALSMLPKSRDLYLWGLSFLSEDTDPDWFRTGTDEYKLQRAVAYHVVVGQGTSFSENRATPGRWALEYKRVTYNPSVWIDKIGKLHERLQGVQIENTDAIKLIERIGRMDDALIYCDPPYPSQIEKVHEYSDQDRGRLIECLSDCKSLVALGGYAQDQGPPGWNEHTLDVSSSLSISNTGSKRVECLWTNW